MSTADDFTWMAHSACANKKTDWWFDKANEQVALGICHQCPVEHRCFEYAVNDPHINEGVFGGATSNARNNERRRRQIPILSRYEGAYRASRTTPRKAEP